MKRLAVVMVAALAACHAGFSTGVPDVSRDASMREDAFSGEFASAAPKPTVYVSNASRNSVIAFLESANGNVLPLRTLAGIATQIHAPAAVTVAANGWIYVANGTNTIAVFAPGAAGNAAPLKVIACGGLNKPSALTVDAANNVYVANRGGNSVSVFSATATGCVAGNHVIAGAATLLQAPSGIAIRGAQLYVANFASNRIAIFMATATGNAPPTGTITGIATKLNAPEGLAFDLKGNVYAANAASITEYAGTARGNALPVRTITGAATTLIRAASLGAGINGRIFVLDGSRAIDAYTASSNGNAVPVQRVSGLNTQLTGSTAMAIFEPLQVVGVHLFGEASANDPTYGFVLGYFNGTSSAVSQVVHLTAGDPVVFKNVDTVPHTASFLGAATATAAHFPASFNGSATTSPAGATLGAANFSSGPLNGGQTSSMYFGLPGFYMYGCAFHYDLFHMRTVIVVQ